MSRYPWVLAVLSVLSLAGLPAACTSSDGAGGTGGGSTITADECNPVTGAGCTGEGAACDLDDGSGYFVCFPPPNTAAACGTCDDSSTTCGQSLTCIQTASAPTASCYRYCCTDEDCGPGGSCDAVVADTYLSVRSPNDNVGVCVASISTQAPSCNTPTTAPSGGACVMGYASADGGTDDGGATDGGLASDSGAADSGAADSGSPDGGSPDGGSPDGG